MSFNEKILIGAKCNGESIISDGSLNFIKNFKNNNYDLSEYNLQNYQDFSLNLSLSSLKIQSNLLRKYIKKVTCGESHCLFLTQAGMIFTLGENKFGQLGLSNVKKVSEPTIMTSMLNYRVSSIASGKNHNLVIATSRDLQTVNSDDLKENFLFVFGDNSYGQLGLENIDLVEVPKINEFFNGKKIVKIDCGLNHSALIIKNDIFIFGKIRPDNNLGPLEKPIKINEKILCEIAMIESFDENIDGLFSDFSCSKNNVFCITKCNFL